MTLQWWVVLYLVLHCIACVLLYVGIRLHLIRFSSQLLPVVVLVPGAGVVVALLAEYNSRLHKTGGRKIELEELRLQEDDLRLSRLDNEEQEEQIIPLEEAMSVNEAEVRRKLMLDILHENPGAYVELLQKARLDEDIEVTHYASTAMMEMQREFELELQKAETEYRKNPDQYENVNQYLNILNRYLHSGLIGDNIRFVYRTRYEQILKQKIEMEPENMEVRMQAVDNYIDAGNMTEAHAMVNAMINRWPSREEPWLAKLKICQYTYDYAGIQSVLSEIKKRNIYLSLESKEVIRFWEKE